MRNHAVVVMAFLVGLGAHDVFAQQATSLEQLQVLVNVGDTISVTDSTGRLSKGDITELSRFSLRLLTEGLIRELSESDVVEISQRRSDSLANGARTGALVGLGLGVLTIIGACANPEVDCGSWGGAVYGALFVSSYTALGVGMGVGIDAMVGRETVIYRARRETASSRTTLKPDFRMGRRGLVVSVAF